MAKYNENDMNQPKTWMWILLIAIVGIAVYKMWWTTEPKVTKSTKPVEMVETKSDLTKAADDLDTVNLDSMDAGLNQLNTESNNF